VLCGGGWTGGRFTTKTVPPLTPAVVVTVTGQHLSGGGGLGATTARGGEQPAKQTKVLIYDDQELEGGLKRWFRDTYRQEGEL
jgi:hypothetical protein